jgi:tRNA(Ile)-lysidine synthase
MAHREGNFGRPLLGVSKEQLQEFCTSRSLAWREDASNGDAVFLRNRVRAELVGLDKFNPVYPYRETPGFKP